MAPGSIASSDTSTSVTSTTSTVGLPGSSGTEKPGTSHSSVRAPRRHPPVLHMVLEALQAGEQRRGTSVAAIKVYILNKYPAMDVIRLKYLLKQALATGMHRGLLARPTNSKARGATGSFKLVPKHKRKIQSKKTSTTTAPRRPGEAKGKGPKKPSEAKKDPPNAGEMKKGPRRPGEVMTASLKPGAAEKKAPKKGSRTKDQESRLGEARKAPSQPDKATRAPPSASGPGRKSKVKGGRSSQADAEAHRRTKAGSQSSKPTVTKGKSATASPARKKVGNKVPKEATAQGAREGPKVRATAPSKGSGSKTMPAPLAGKTEAPKDPRRPCTSTKASTSNVASKKPEPRARGGVERD
ncbi:histone H1.8 [Equus quagga]|uniref:histone H1.8 n=1 Tax=Equus quagga TaxID=89248 RepID=UPI001EE2A1D9|nr:histone H1.8 [Equus quagga]